MKGGALDLCLAIVEIDVSCERLWNAKELVNLAIEQDVMIDK